jgi:hypothetical protein
MALKKIVTTGGARAGTTPLKVRLTEDAQDMLRQLQDYYGLSMSSTIELVIREQARTLGLAQGRK